MKKKGFTAWQIKDLFAPALALRRNGGRERCRFVGKAYRLAHFNSHTNGRLGFAKCKALSSTFAFTLAEVLITLTIIGVVAALTIPSVIRAYQEQQYKTAFRKAYREATQAWHMAIAENPDVFTNKGGWGCTWPDGITTDYSKVDGRADAIKAQMKVIKSCINKSGCWPLNYESYGGLPFDTGYVNTFFWITADGMCWGAPWYTVDTTHLAVDTNCEKGPNKIGKDIFSFLLGTDGAIYFAIDDKSANGKPVRSGNVCPYVNAPVTINGRSVDFKEYLKN